MYLQVKIFLVFFLLLNSFVFAQSKSVNALQIILNKCGQCHHNESSAPFSLLSYNDVSKYSKMIKYVVEEGLMPPVMIDTSYRNFGNVVALNTKEKSLILNWIEDGMPFQEAVIQNDVVEKRNGKEIKIRLRTSKKIENFANDQFNYKVISLPIKDSILVSGYEYEISNKLLHHLELLDLKKSTSVNVNKVFNTNSYELKNSGISIDRYLFGWFPGSDIGIFPKGTGIKLYGDRKILLISHYTKSLEVIKEKSYLDLFIEKKNAKIREIKELGLYGTAKFIKENGFENPFLEPEEIKSFIFNDTLKDESSVFGVYFHAHHLCKNMKAFAVTPENDTINLLKIDKWDFDRQFTYRLNEYIVLPKNTVIYCSALYDNTSENINNPNLPPKKVLASFNSEDEMFEFFLIYLDYKDGDEQLKIEY